MCTDHFELFYQNKRRFWDCETIFVRSTQPILYKLGQTGNVAPFHKRDWYKSYRTRWGKEKDHAALLHLSVQVQAGLQIKAVSWWKSVALCKQTVQKIIFKGAWSQHETVDENVLPSSHRPLRDCTYSRLPPHYDMSPFHGANTKTALNSAPQSQPELLHGILAKSIPRLRCLPRNNM